MILPSSFYIRNTALVARQLLGKKLVRMYRGDRIAGRITEVEAYLGTKDKACHTYQGRRTPRTEAMYLAGGNSYIYFVYGMHHCFNVVTQPEGIPEAVLIRSLEPLEGIHWMKKFRKMESLRHLTNGPAKLTQALKIDQKLNFLPLTSTKIFIEDAPSIPAAQIVKKERIGVAYAGEHAAWPLRFYIRGNPYISKV